MAQRLSPLMSVMQNTAMKASKRLLRDFNEVEQLQVSIKGPSDFVSQADLRAEATIREELVRARPGFALMMEESGASGSDNWAWRWVVDPLDGTTNFLHGMPHWAVSIALQKRLPDGSAELAAGMILQPRRERDVLGREGCGRLAQRPPAARLGASRHQRGGVRHRHPVRRGVRSESAAFRPHPRRADAPGRRHTTLRRPRRWISPGSPAGRFDGYWEMGVKQWDCAAGLLMVREAGGFATDPAGRDHQALETECDVVACNFRPARQAARDRRGGAISRPARLLGLLC